MTYQEIRDKLIEQVDIAVSEHKKYEDSFGSNAHADRTIAMILLNLHTGTLAAILNRLCEQEQSETDSQQAGKSPAPTPSDSHHPHS